MIRASRNMRRRLKSENANQSARLLPTSKWQWPDDNDPKRKEVWRSRNYLVQVFTEDDGVLRVSVNRTTIKLDGGWEENISWEELQEIKGQIGRGDKYAIEIYPRDCDIVNVANMRHIWILPKILPIGWRNVIHNSESLA